MTRDELMERVAEKAVAEESWETIEFLFRPTGLLAILLRNDFDAMCNKIRLAMIDATPEDCAVLYRLIEVEEFYQRIVEVRNERNL